MSISIAARKSKARVLQKWIAEKVSELTGFDCGKDNDIESRPMGQSGCDVRLSADVRKKFPFSVEAKNSESWDLPAAIRQAQSNLYDETEWLVFLKKNNVDPIAILDAEIFFQILKHADLSLCEFGANNERIRKRVSKSKEKVEKDKKSKTKKPKI